MPGVTLNIPTNITGARDGIAVVPIDINTLFDPINGDSGLEGADFVVDYNSSLFTVGSTDVYLGAVPSASTGWSVLVNANTPGVLIIGLSNSGAGIITTTAGGSLVTMNFHVNAGDAFGTTSARRSGGGRGRRAAFHPRLRSEWQRLHSESAARGRAPIQPMA